MIFRTRISAAFVAASALLSGCRSQAPEPTVYTDPSSGITFDTWNLPGNSKTGGLTFGVALPSTALKEDATDFIGYLHCAAAKESTSADSWCGIALGGSMIDSLLFLAYPDKDAVRTSLRFTSGYSMPGVYGGNATVKEIGSVANATGFSLVFHCQDCLHWSQNGTSGSASTKSGLLDLGYAQSAKEPSNPSCPQSLSFARHDTQGTWTAMLDENATSESYDKWCAQANHRIPDNCSTS
ncbi:hypothetical protein BBP40_008468 [Aspergillus hancockii]|nr:hypothetical protein BBP40_008468 [Aspergillus hancockii]